MPVDFSFNGKIYMYPCRENKTKNVTVELRIKREKLVNNVLCQFKELPLSCCIWLRWTEHNKIQFLSSGGQFCFMQFYKSCLPESFTKFNEISLSNNNVCKSNLTLLLKPDILDFPNHFWLLNMTKWRKILEHEKLLLL